MLASNGKSFRSLILLAADCRRVEGSLSAGRGPGRALVTLTLRVVARRWDGVRSAAFGLDKSH